MAGLLWSVGAAADLNQVILEAAQYQSGASAVPLRQIEQAVRESAGNRAQRAEVEAALIKLLAPTSTLEARRFACTQLAIIGPDAALPTLAEMLSDPETAGMACLALGSNPSAATDRLLLDALSAASGGARLQIVVTLGDRRVAAAVRPLERLVRDPDRATQAAAIGALGKIATDEALRVLAALRRDANSETARQAVLASLVAADRSQQNARAIYEDLLAASQPVYVRGAAFEGLLRTDADGGEKRCLDALRGNEPVFKPSAIVHVRKLKSPRASARFAAEMPKLTPAEQALMIESLAARNDADARAAITDRILAEDATVRQAAVVALASVGDAGSVPVLAKALGSAPNAASQQTIEMALASLKGGAQVDQAMLKLLANAAPTAKVGLINALARRSAKSALPALLDESASVDPAVAKAAFRALGKLAASADLPVLLNHLASLKAEAARAEAESACVKVLERTADPAQRSAAVAAALAKASGVEDRCSLLSLLPACGDVRALELVKTARASQEPAVREAALRALAEWPDASAIDPLLEVAQTTAQNTERVLALRGSVRLLGVAGNLPAADLAARFQKAMAVTKNAGEKKLVLGGLGNVHDPVALKLAEPYLTDAEVRAEAAQAVATLAPRLCGAYRAETRSALQQLTAQPVAADVKQKAADLLAIMGRFDDFLLGWQVAGPFAQEGKDGQALFDVAFPPEQPGAPNVKWQLLPAGLTQVRPWQLDLGKFFGGDHRVAYARAWIYSETGQAARLELGSDDGIKAWVNGQVVIAANRGGDVAPGAEKANVTLRQGWNSVLLKVTQWTAGWGFCARLAKPDGSPLPGLRVAVTPP